MRKFTTLTLIFFLVISVAAQTKSLTLEDATLGRATIFNPEDIQGLKWRDNGRFTFIKNRTQLVQSTAKDARQTDLINLEEVNRILSANKIPALPVFGGYEWITPSLLKINPRGFIVMLNMDTKKIFTQLQYPENAANLHYNDKTGDLAYTIENNVFINTKDGKTIQVTKDDNKGIVNGSNYVHRQEFGIKEGLFWSTNGQALAYYRKDETMVADYPLVDVTTRIATLKPVKYPMAGETSEQVTLNIFYPQTSKTISISPMGHKDDYLTHIGWDPNDRFIYIAELNRAQNHLHFNKYDAETGALVTTLFEEKNEKWVEPENDMVFLKKHPDQFIWFSERDGYTHLYLYNTAGRLIKQLTSGNFIITELLGLDEKEENLYVLTTEDSPLERQLYQVNIRSGKSLKLTREPGTHRISFNPDKNFFVDNYSAFDNPRTVALVGRGGKPVRTLLKSSDPIRAANIQLGRMHTGRLKAADGLTDLYYRMIQPPKFDSLKKYPVIIYVYGGPHAQLITNNWLGGAGLFDYYLAQQGFIVFTLDNRGSANRGFAFESVIHRQNGQEEMKDQMKGVAFLKSLPYIDTSRIGVSGWSYGGFMATSLITNFPETFKVGVAGGPVIDWKYYEVMYGERYMDTPAENPEGYAKTSLLSKAGKLKGRLLMIHGYVDPVVVPQNSLMFLKAATDANVQVDYSIYPTHEHNVLGKDRVNLNARIARYFQDFLK
jgi:dipeptidyl-peptidase-4